MKRPEPPRSRHKRRVRKEKAPAAICRKVAEAEDESVIEVWGDGEQTRSFCYIDDCVDGLIRIMDSGYVQPLNLGTDEIVTVNQLVALVISASGKELAKAHDLTKPQGVRGRTTHKTILREVSHCVANVPLGTGMRRTFDRRLS